MMNKLTLAVVSVFCVLIACESPKTYSPNLNANTTIRYYKVENSSVLSRYLWVVSDWDTNDLKSSDKLNTVDQPESKLTSDYLLKITDKEQSIDFEVILSDTCFYETHFKKLKDSILIESWLNMESYHNRMFILDYPLKFRNEEEEIIEYKSKTNNQVDFSIEGEISKQFHCTSGYILRKDKSIILESKRWYANYGDVDYSKHNLIATETSSDLFENLKNISIKNCR